MAKFEYVAAEPRDYLYPVAFTVAPGDVVEAKENPDPTRFKPVSVKKEKE